jgi:hypothetical protein
MKRDLGILTAKLFMGVMVALTLVTQMAVAGPKEDLSTRQSDWDKVKRRMEDTETKVNNYLVRSTKIRAMDKTELESLITQICSQDIARNDDEADRLAKSIRDKIIENVRREYDSISAEGDRLGGGEVENVMNDAKSLRENTKSLLSYAEVKDDTDKLLKTMIDEIDKFTNKVYEKFTTDYKTLSNLKEGWLKGSNDPKIRAAMEYGKEKHLYNQRICEEKELTLSSGRPDCVSFQKDNCIVWEFKPDSYSESDAKSQAEKYLRDVQDKFKDDPRAVSNCAKDSSGKPKFEARGVLYPRCKYQP